ncbi:MAG: OsmC family protein [Candidatus Omnitrophica bacterium]|nr:OsmC family protein [Candidatus Omnitrophota bacterium]
MYQVEITNESGYVFNVKSKDYQFVIDTKGKGITPPDTLLASLGSCVGVYIRKYAEDLRLELGNFNIKVEADLCREKPVRFTNINININLKDSGMDESRKKSLLEFIKNCPINNTLLSAPLVDVKITG